MSSLRYDHRGITTGTIGSHGLDPQARRALQPKLAAAREAVVAARERGELGFLNCPDIDLAPITSWAREKRGRFTDQVVIGIGGSSLGARAVLASASGDLDGLDTHFAENIDPVSLCRLFERLDLERTLFVVVTKSGSTVETMSQFWIAYDRVIDAVGEERAAEHFVAITDPKRGSLRALAEARGFDTFEVPPNVGGRFSVLTAVGLVPLALAGYDVEGLIAGAAAARERALSEEPEANALLQAAGDQYLLDRAGYPMTVMMAYSDQLYPLVDWFCQLWAESLGKAKNRAGETVNVGMTPVKALGVIDQHSQVQLYIEGPRDKNVVFLEVERFDRDLTVPTRDGFPEALSHLQGKSIGELLHAELVGTRRALQDAERPTSRWIFESVTAEAVGAFVFGWEFMTAIAGELLDIDAFDQPGVELGKKIAHGLLGREGFEDYKRMAEEGGEEAEEAGALPVC